MISLKRMRTLVKKEFPDMSPEGRESVALSRYKLQFIKHPVSLIQVDLGINASKNVKRGLFK